MNNKPTSRSCSPTRPGVATVELAVCLPMIVLLVMASIEACNMIFLDYSLSIASYEGARVAIQHDATNSEVMGKCNQILTARQVASPTITIAPSDVATVPRGQPISITLSAPCDANAYSPPWFFGGRTIRAECTMVKE